MKIILRLAKGILTRRINVPDSCNTIFRLPFLKSDKDGSLILPDSFDEIAQLVLKVRPPIMEFQRHLTDAEGCDHCPIYDLISIN